MAGKERWVLGLGPFGKAVAAGAGALLLLALGVLVWQTGQNRADSNAAPITQEKPLTPEELQVQLQKQADESSFRIRLNSRPHVTGRKAELLLANPVENKTNLSVTITLNQGGKTIYESGPLIPGAQVLTAELTRELPPGEHQATAACTSLDPETGERVGSRTLVDMVLAVEKPSKASGGRVTRDSRTQTGRHTEKQTEKQTGRQTQGP